MCENKQLPHQTSIVIKMIILVATVKKKGRWSRTSASVMIHEYRNQYTLLYQPLQRET